MVFSHDSKKLASASDDKTIQIWSVKTGKREQVLEGHTDLITSAVFSHDSKTVAPASDNHTIRIWNANTGKCEEMFPLDGFADVLSFTPDERGIVTNRGVFLFASHLQPRVGSAMPWQYSEAPVLGCKDSTWITVTGKDLLWLPPEYRNREVVVSGGKVIIGCQSGRVVF